MTGDPEVGQIRYFIDRMMIHSTLTARHLDIPPAEALPALVVTALVLAERHDCTDLVTARIRDFCARSGVVSLEELDRWMR